MASNTENLNLLMKNPSTDGADTFNVQTMLNENWQKIDNNAGTVAQTLANILKPTTPQIIGLPPSTTPDGMFQALGNTGELHVWRKTVVSSSEQPAGYTLGDVIENSEIWVENRYDDAVFHYATSISVSDTGLVSLVGEKTATIGHSNNGENIAEFDVFKGKFVYISGGDNNKREFIFYIPANATFHRDGNYSTNKIYADKEQRVNAHGIIPPGTTTTYPVSTNPKAYQEGDDAKAAGYVLGDVVNTTLVIAYRQNTVCNFSYSDALSVADDGSISLSNPTSGTAGGSYNGAPTYLSGKFLKFVSISGNGGTTLKEGVIYYIPSNATIKIGSYAGYVDAEIDRYQPVTGYAAIPAGTSIEYLGKLGDKARVQVLSYVGTGTYGSDHPNSLTFGSLPEAIIFLGKVDSSGSVYSVFYTQQETRVLYPKIIPNGRNDVNGYGFGYSIYGKRDGNTISWYSTKNQDCQANSIGHTFYYLVLS